MTKEEKQLNHIALIGAVMTFTQNLEGFTGNGTAKPFIGVIIDSDSYKEMRRLAHANISILNTIK